MTLSFANLNTSATVNNSSFMSYDSIGRKALILVPGALEIISKALPRVDLDTFLERNGPISKKIYEQLPLESLFSKFIGSKNTNESKLHVNLTSALLNHSLHHGSDDELDRIVFSNLPQGSKLVLKSIKILKTDENGNEEPLGDPAISFDVLPIDPSLDFDSETNHEPDSSESPEVETQDLASDASSHGKSGYDSYGSNDKLKENTQDHRQAQEYDQNHKETHTDTEGMKVKNYKGHEKGLTNFDNGHGSTQSNDGERFKNSKQKNKRRKVTGFKRVYHKEEFQRTEHFYDDEEAKKVAESYGLVDSKEKSEDGKNDDQRKYHGTRVEVTDGQKVKNEHSTHHGDHKSRNEGHKNSDIYRQSNQYSNQRHTPTNYGRHQIFHNHYHPNHNYNGAYSHVMPNEDVNQAPTEDTVITTHREPISNGEISYPPSQPSTMERNEGFVDEMRIFRAQRDRSPTQLNYYYAPNFGPPTSTDIPKYNNYLSQVQTDNIPWFYRSNFGSTNVTMRPVTTFIGTTPKIRMNLDERYAVKYSSPKPSHIDSPQLIPKLIPINHQERNLISIDKAVGTQIAPGSTFFREPSSQGVFFNSGYSNWNPIPSGSINTPQNINTRVIINDTEQISNSSEFGSDVRNGPMMFHDSNSSSIPQTSPFGWDTGDHNTDPLFPPRPFYHHRDSGWRRPLPYIRFRSHGDNNAPPSPPPIPLHLPMSTNFFREPTTIQYHQQNYEDIQSASSGHNSYPSFSNFMNGLMNSVSEFFNNLG